MAAKTAKPTGSREKMAAPVVKPKNVSHRQTESQLCSAVLAGGVTYEEATPLQRFVGGFVASCFSFAYLVCPAVTLIALVLLAFKPFSSITWCFVVPCAVSALAPPFRCLFLLETWAFQQMLKYFSYSEALDTSDLEVEEVMKTKPVIIVQCPHGVIPFGGICSAVCRPSLMPRLPTAVASILLHLPLLKHTLGIFGILSADKNSLRKRLANKQAFVLYLGGIAELFKSSPTSERLHMLNRKGFIKLSLQHGAVLCPTYIFGNTQMLMVAKGPLKEKLSRALQASFTFFWGRWGTPIPHNTPVLYARGHLIELPVIADPSQEDIDLWHGKLVAEYRRLYSQNQHKVEGYANKELIIE